MRKIEKGPKPPCLGPLEGRGNYDELDADCKRAVRKALVKEQRAACCYCTRNIDEESLEIEHLFPRHPGSEDLRTKGAKLELAWNNLLASCSGNRGMPRSSQHCNAAKANHILWKLSPLTTSVARLRFLDDGEICSGDADIEHDATVILSLNAPSLVKTRKWTLTSYLMEFCRAHPQGTWSAALIERELKKVRAEPRPLDGAVVHYLERKLAKATRPAGKAGSRKRLA